jgi:hypothetical protein
MARTSGAPYPLVFFMSPIHLVRLACFLAVVPMAILAQPNVRAEQNPASGEPANYIPTDVTDAVRVLKKELDPAYLATIKKPKPDEEYDLFFLGTGLRNSWGLWRDSRLKKWFQAHGVGAPEDMTAIIINALQADLRGEPFDLDKELKETHAGELQAVDEAKQEKHRALEAADRISQMMLHVLIVGKPAQNVVLPPRHYWSEKGTGIRVRSLTSFAGGFLITEKYMDGDNDDDCHSTAYFLDSKCSGIHPLRVKGMTRVDSEIVIGAKAYFAGSAPRGDLLVVSDGHSVQPLPSPPGSGRFRLGQDGERLLVLRKEAVYRLDGDKWSLVVETQTPIPWSLVPPLRVGNRIYLRDEGRGEDDKRLWWIDLDHGGDISCFDKDCGVVGPAGPRWENVWSFAVEPSGRLWAAAGYSLLRWDPTAGYHVALMNGNPAFTGELIRGTDPATTNTSWTQIDPHDSSETVALAITGIALGPAPDTITLCGPKGLFRLTGNVLTPLLTFTKTAQEVPMGELNPTTKEENVYHWSLDPTHLLPFGKDSWLIGGHWEGVYLLARDKNGAYQFTALDEKSEPEVTLDQLPSP